MQVDKAATLSTTQDQYLFAPTYALDQQGGKGGANYAEEVMPTLCSDSHGTPHAVAYSFDSLASNSMKSKNPHSGCRQVDVAKTLDTTDPNPCKNQGGIAVLQPVASLLLDDQGGQQIGVRTDEKSPTLRAEAHGNVPAVVCKEQYLFENHSQDTRYRGPLEVSPMLPAQLGTGGNNTPFVVEGDEGCTTATLASGRKTVGTLMANAGTKLWLGNQEAFSGDYHIIEGSAVRYIVRRLTPTECARLQGFADRWGDIDEKDSFTPEEYEFWMTVRNTHAAINGKVVKDYTEAQMLTWYSKLQTDSAEYKMWGNGIALPPALYCLQGIVEALESTEDDDWML